jgi:hypothetical protein
MAAVRIATGLLCLLWTVSLLPDASAFLSGSGIVPAPPSERAPGAWAVELPWPLLLGTLAVASTALTVGWRSRAAAVFVLVCLVLVQRRNPYVVNSGDLLLRAMAFYLVLMPSGESWSVDAWRRRTAGRLPQPRAAWPLLLLRVQIGLMYAFAFMAKALGEPWRGGLAVGQSLQLEDLQRVPVPFGVAADEWVSRLLTFGTLGTELVLALALLLPVSWRYRRWALLLGVALHLGIDGTLLVGWFSWAVVAAYLAFVPDDVLGTLAERARRRWRRRPPEHRPGKQEAAGAAL